MDTWACESTRVTLRLELELVRGVPGLQGTNTCNLISYNIMRDDYFAVKSMVKAGTAKPEVLKSISTWQKKSLCIIRDQIYFCGQNVKNMTGCFE
jgi:hypothetical protein